MSATDLIERSSFIAESVEVEPPQANKRK